MHAGLFFSIVVVCATTVNAFIPRGFRAAFSTFNSQTQQTYSLLPTGNAVARQAIQAAQVQRLASTSLDMVRTYASVAELLNSPEFSDEEEEEEEETAPAQAPIIIEDGGQGISPLKAGIQFPTTLNGTDVRVGIIMARWNGDIVQGLYKGINESLANCGVKTSNIFATYVPGAYELPITAKFLAASKRFDVLICVGCLIKGDTMHFEYIADATANGIMNVQIETMTPCLFGVLTVLNKDQAIKRSVGKENEGLSWGKSAVEMGLARMSAMGAFATKDPSKDGLASMVVFNASMPAKPTPAVAGAGGKNETKKFGF